MRTSNLINASNVKLLVPKTISLVLNESLLPSNSTDAEPNFVWSVEIATPFLAVIVTSKLPTKFSAVSSLTKNTFAGNGSTPSNKIVPLVSSSNCIPSASELLNPVFARCNKKF